jgi:RNA polymerase sigma-70 factor (ECF subfamily)
MSSLVAPDKTTGTERQLEELFREHYPMLYRTAISILDNPADADDVPQTVFLRLLRTGPPPEMRRNPAGYLYRAAVNVSLNVIRTRKRSRLTEGIENLEVAVDSSSTVAIERMHQHLAEAIAELPQDAAHVLILRYVHNYPEADIARLLGASRGMVAMRLFRARGKLKKLMRSSWETIK